LLSELGGNVKKEIHTELIDAIRLSICRNITGAEEQHAGAALKRELDFILGVLSAVDAIVCTDNLDDRNLQRRLADMNGMINEALGRVRDVYTVASEIGQAIDEHDDVPTLMASEGAR
jgi:hypothetical protein